MLTYYARHTTRDSFEVTTLPSQYRHVWLHGSEITKAEVATLVETHRLDLNIVQDIFDTNELPRIEYDDAGNLYVFLRIAWRSRHSEVATGPYVAIVTKQDFITLTQTKWGRPNDIIARRPTAAISDTLLLLLATFAAFVAEYEELVHHTAGTVRRLKQRLKNHEASNDDFYRFITIEENLATYHYNLAAMYSVAERLRDDARIALEKHHAEALDDILLHIKQLRASVDSSSHAVTSLYNVYATVSNNVLNQRMKALTIVTLVVTIPNVFYGMYGMNIALPFAEQPWAFMVIMLFTIVIITIVLLLVRRSKLL